MEREPISINHSRHVFGAHNPRPVAQENRLWVPTFHDPGLRTANVHFISKKQICLLHRRVYHQRWAMCRSVVVGGLRQLCSKRHPDWHCCNPRLQETCSPTCQKKTNWRNMFNGQPPGRPMRVGQQKCANRPTCGSRPARRCELVNGKPQWLYKLKGFACFRTLLS